LVVFGLGLEVVMGRGKRLRKSAGGELEVNKQNVAAANEGIILPSVPVSEEAILLPYVAREDEAVESHVAALDVAIVEENIVASDATIG
jgi:hypothetical protein